MKAEIKLFMIITAFFAFGCEQFEPAPPNEADLLDGPAEGLSEAENIRFLRGDIAFNDEIFTPETGLGPLFVANSCGSCHPGDGKGHPFTTLTRFGQYDDTGNQYRHLGGPSFRIGPSLDLHQRAFRRALGFRNSPLRQLRDWALLMQ